MDTHRVDGMCAHNKKILAIEGWGNSSHVQNNVDKKWGR
jgi:hypothetical protein